MVTDVLLNAYDVRMYPLYQNVLSMENWQWYFSTITRFTNPVYVEGETTCLESEYEL